MTPTSETVVTVRCLGILFDMDGILISSLASVERSWRTWAVGHGIDPALVVHSAHGCRAIETIRRFRPDLSDSGALAELKSIEDLEVADQDDLTVLPGVLSLLNALPPERWAIVTSATHRLALVRLAAGGVPIPAKIITSDHVTEGKPSPVPFLRGAELLGLSPASCVVFEDSASGAKAGRAAGCTVIATTFSHTREELPAAHHFIPDLTAIRVEILPNQSGLALHFTPLPI